MRRVVFLLLMLVLASTAIATPRARLSIWADQHGSSNLTATIDGDRIIEINASASAAADAMGYAADVVAARESVLAAADAAQLLAPTETDRVAFANGWSQRVELDGSVTTWQHRHSPYDPAVDAAEYQQARGTNVLDGAAFRSVMATASQNVAQVRGIMLAMTPNSFTNGFTTAQQRTTQLGVRSNMLGICGELIDANRLSYRLALMSLNRMQSVTNRLPEVAP